MRKGIVLTIDALIAVLLMGIFLMVISFELSPHSESPYLFKYSSDFLTVLDKGTILKNITNQTDQQAEDTLSFYLSVLPRNIGANLTVSIYEYRESSDDFEIKRVLSSKKGTKQGDVVVLKRVFADPRKEEYGITLLEMWYE